MTRRRRKQVKGKVWLCKGAVVGIVAATGCVQVLGDFRAGNGPADGGTPDGGPPADTGADQVNTEASPEAEAGPPPNVITDAVQVSAGEHHTCAIRAGGDVYCWGSNTSGQLGVSSATTTMSNRPVKVPLTSPAVQVSAGYLHTCAVDQNHALWCWGANDTAQLGLGTTSPSELPQIVMTSALSGVSQVSGGEHHSCAVSTSGDVYCWGANDVAQISATSGITSYPSPTQVPLPNTDAASLVSAASHHSCAVLQTTPYLACWGNQTAGELGTGAAGPQPPTPPSITSMPSFLGTAAGHDHSCGVNSSHQVWCWGGDPLGQTGAPASTSSVPAVVAGTGSVLQVTAGTAFTCALNNVGDVYCWGSNSAAQLGGGAPPDTAAHATPAKVIMLNGAVQVSAGSAHACAVLQGTSDGGIVAGPLVCWGNNADGELGDGTTVMARATPAPVVQN